MPGTSHSTVKTIVLAHGGFVDGSCWGEVHHPGFGKLKAERTARANKGRCQNHLGTHEELKMGPWRLV